MVKQQVHGYLPIQTLVILEQLYEKLNVHAGLKLKYKSVIFFIIIYITNMHN